MKKACVVMKKKYNITLLKKHIEREERTDGSFEVNTKLESSKSENEDVMVSCYEKKEKFFNHVDERWQKEKSCLFSRTLNLIERNPKQDIIKELFLNPRVTKMKGDGNCYFRSIFFALTGSQRLHNVVRDDKIILGRYTSKRVIWN
jgi:hemerythrin-like domain-containing protein